MKKILLKNFKKFKRDFVSYILTSRLFVTYTLLAVVCTMFSRFLPLGEFFTLRSILMNTGIILIFGAFGYFVKPEKRFVYYLTWLIIYAIIGFVNNIYYIFFSNFASFGDLATAGQAGEVAGSLFDRFSPKDFVFLIFPILFYIYHKKLKSTAYYNYISKIERSNKTFNTIIITGIICMGIACAFSNGADFSRLRNQWNRQSNVNSFGILFYQINDLVQTMIPKFSALFGYEDAKELFDSYYEDYEPNTNNEYTGIFEDKNIVFIHMESIQSFLLDMSYNGKEVTPRINQLAEEGMYFSNFYPQVSTGNSADSEFTLLSSFYPASTGTIFVNYYDRYYNTMPQVLSERGYTTFSMHGNNISMWNRNNAHPALGYQEMYFENEYVFEDTDKIGLGINDSLFLKQSLDYLTDIENKSTNYMGSIITLTNHSPFYDVSQFAELDLSEEVMLENEDGEMELTTVDYLSELAIGRYLKSSHYADQTIGEFIDYINESPNFNDTIFIFYGDHDARFSQQDYNFLINYDPLTGELKDELDETYIQYDAFDHLIAKKTPLIIWTKDTDLREKINGTFDYPIGMIDVYPTLFNMMGLENKYALGKDIFNIKSDNYVIFPNASFLTSEIYYNNSTGEYKALKEDVILSEDYITYYSEIANTELRVSNAVVTHDLIYDILYGRKDEEVVE